VPSLFLFAPTATTAGAARSLLLLLLLERLCLLRRGIRGRRLCLLSSLLFELVDFCYSV
jgi:hypothetical protein